MTTGILGYNSSNDRYGLLVMDLWEIDGFHCGETLEVWNYDKEQWIPTRIEMNRNGWYLVGYDADCLEGLKVRVRA
ncbi:MAG: DUF5348 domain-containing protein [Ruminococcus sp.]|nr:DUF5348 domain-containing protein [Ruminococcus sp.]